MDLFLPLVSFILIAGGQGRQYASFADAATTTATNMETLTANWEAALPGTPVPPAIRDMLTQQNGLRKIGPNHEAVNSEADHGGKHIHTVLQVEDDSKEVHVSQGEKDIKKVMMAHAPITGKHLRRPSISHGKDDLEKKIAVHRTKVEENPKEVLVPYELVGDNTIKEVSMSYGIESEDILKELPAHEEKLKEVSVSHGLEGDEDLKEVSVSYGVDSDDILKELCAHEENLKEVSVSYGLEGEGNLLKVQQHLKKIPAAYTPWKDEKLKEVSVSYGSKGEQKLKEVSMSYGVDGRDNLKEVSLSYGLEGKKDLKEVSVSYGVDGRENLNEVSATYGSKGMPKEASESYGLKGANDFKKMAVSYRLDDEKILKGVSRSHAEKQKEVTMSYGSIEEPDVPNNKVTEEGSEHVHAHIYKNKKEADVFFFHDMLRPGSLITPTIPPTTSMPALLPGDVADSIPFSTEHLSDIITMFAPTSLTMAREIRWTLDTCEHPRTLPGQKAGCATSLESLVELPASLLGRRNNVRAFSAVDLPMDEPGTPALRGRYNVTAARKLSGSSSEVVTCHDLTYPYAVYYCHTSSPTAAYMVTLASVEEDASPATMEVMAVCHLDTSLWSPKNPFFELHKVRPGNVAVCHFLTKLSIIWVSVDGHVDTL